MKNEIEMIKSNTHESLILKGTKRYYFENLANRDYTLENTTPYMVTIFDKVIEEHSWGKMLVKVVDLMLERIRKSREELLSFRTNWSKKAIFTIENKVNHKLLRCGLFFNCNHTAQHSCWLLQDVLDFLLIDKTTVQLIIHRAPASEPKDIKQYIKKEFKNGFRRYLLEIYQKTEDEIETIIEAIDQVLNKVLQKESRSYNDLFLFDEYAYAYNYCQKVKKYLELNLSCKDRSKYIECLDLLLKYYSCIEKEKRL